MYQGDGQLASYSIYIYLEPECRLSWLGWSTNIEDKHCPGTYILDIGATDIGYSQQNKTLYLLCQKENWERSPVVAGDFSNSVAEHFSNPMLST